jgi:hypothetical protein
MIENNILAISKAMFNNKQDWNKVTDTQKEQFFFIFNRYFSKKYPSEAFHLNDQNQNKSFGMDVWFEFMKNKPYPNWFWSKPKDKDSKTETFTNKDKSMLLEHLDLKNEELSFLIKHHKDELIEELDYLKKCNKI